jgi:hypothetical protein
MPQENTHEVLQDQSLEVLSDSSLAALTKAELDVQIVTAKRYPRSIKRFLDNAVSLATLDEEIAASCIFRLPRGGKSIEGKSVRLAEVCASQYQNLRIASRIKDVTDTEVVAEAVAIDLENNVGYSSESRRSIIDSRGNRYKQDMIIMTCNAACAIASRNATFKAIPLPLVEKVYQKARLVAVGDEKTLGERRAKMLAHFAKLGVDKDKIFHHLDIVGIDDINLDHIETLIGYANAIKDGSTTIDEIFNPEPVEPVTTKIESVSKPSINGGKVIETSDEPTNPDGSPLFK